MTAEQNFKWNKSKRGVCIRLWHHNVRNSIKRGHKPPEYSQKELIDWILKQPNFELLYTNWKISNYKQDFAVSIDRLDDSKGYSFDNIQLVTFRENYLKSHQGFRDKTLYNPTLLNSVHTTIYQYDIYGNLTYVIPPKLVEVGGITLATYTSNLAELGYQYQYDEKNRLVEKQLPGKGREFMVYDKLDRLVATRDSQNEWVFTKYDKFGRIVYTGTLPSSARATLQASYNSATVYHETRLTSAGLSNNGITTSLYTNLAYPTSFTKITTLNYYDNYSGLITPSSIDGQTVIGIDDTKTKGLAVASFTNVLGTTTWNKAYTYYDSKYIRPVATASTNYLGGSTNTALSLDFRGKTLKTITKHKQLAASTELTLTDEFTYYPNELLKSQNKLENPCFDYQFNAKGFPYAVVSTNDEYTLSLVFNKYKNFLK